MVSAEILDTSQQMQRIHYTATTDLYESHCVS